MALESSSAPTEGSGTSAVGVRETLIGDSAAMRAVKSVALGVAARRSTVLILGETGCGKERLARFIHDQSDRRHSHFIPVDCSALPSDLFESQMFGHVRGAFTGAVRDGLGFVRAADGGTLFLDEVGELPPPMQAKLLRVIQERTVTPVGTYEPVPVDVRLLVATNRDLTRMVRDGTFREDLYFRLNVLTVQMPPLRERREDVVPLAEYFLRLQAELYDEPAKRLSAEAAAMLGAYAWPGNVRELANAMEHAHVLCSSAEVGLNDLPLRLRSAPTTARSNGDLNLLDIERRAIAEALRRTNYCKAAACRLLGINIKRMNRRIVRLQIAMP